MGVDLYLFCQIYIILRYFDRSQFYNNIVWTLYHGTYVIYNLFICSLLHIGDVDVMSRRCCIILYMNK